MSFLKLGEHGAMRRPRFSDIWWLGLCAISKFCLAAGMETSFRHRNREARANGRKRKHSSGWKGRGSKFFTRIEVETMLVEIQLEIQEGQYIRSPGSSGLRNRRLLRFSDARFTDGRRIYASTGSRVANLSIQRTHAHPQREAWFSFRVQHEGD